MSNLLNHAGLALTEETTSGLTDSFRVEPGQIRSTLATLRNELGYDFLVDLFGVDTQEGVEAVYHLRKNEDYTDIYVRELHPYGGTLTSVWDIYKSALMPERELCEMFGLRLKGHPNPRRLVTTDGCPPFLLKETKIRTADEVHHRERQVIDIKKLDRVAGTLAADPADDPCDLSGLNLADVSAEDLDFYVSEVIPQSIDRAPTGVDLINTEHLVLNMGPQHPSTHGVLRVLLELDGELVVTGETMIGQLHRGIEKLAEHRLYPQLGTLMDRGDYVSGIHGELAASLATEKLLEIEAPRRAQWIRCLTGELCRIASHTVWYGPSALDAGMMGLFLYLWKDREDICDILEELSGQRLMYNYIRPGGVANDLTPGIADKILAFCDSFDKRVIEHEEIVMANEIMVKRIKDVATINKETAVQFGLTGANLRASGGTWDVRKDRPYAAYSELDFEVPCRTEGDIWARFDVRINEMKQACRMIRQCIEGMPEGDYTAKMPRSIKPPAGEAYACVESPRGEVGVHLISDGTANPYRMRYRPPALFALQAGEAILPGMLIADAVVGLGSLDFVLGEIDR